MRYLRLLLLPVSWLYGLVIWLRNKAYDWNIFSSKSFSIPVIGIGNLAVGGAGKSPMAEYLVSHLKEKFHLAILSRGYGRKTSGFRLVSIQDSASTAGDEPLQFKRKFQDITVAVCEKRVVGLDKLTPSHDLVILDDAFQHRAVSPGLNILLFDYTRLNDFPLLLPAGNLREPRASKKRAQILVVTKTPKDLQEKERKQLSLKISPWPDQQLFFSYLDYGQLVPLNVTSNTFPPHEPDRSYSIHLITGIANPQPLVEKLQGLAGQVKHYDYPDHHPFSKKNITKLVRDFEADPVGKKIIITTEKDAQRLKSPELLELLKNLPVFYLPVTAKIHQPDEEKFNNLIEAYATGNLQHYGIHKKKDR